MITGSSTSQKNKLWIRSKRRQSMLLQDREGLRDGEVTGGGVSEGGGGGVDGGG